MSENEKNHQEELEPGFKLADGEELITVGQNKSKQDAEKACMCHYLCRSFPDGTWTCSVNSVVIKDYVLKDGNLKCLSPDFEACEQYQFNKECGLTGNVFKHDNNFI